MSIVRLFRPRAVAAAVAATAAVTLTAGCATTPPASASGGD